MQCAKLLGRRDMLLKFCKKKKKKAVALLAQQT